MTAETCDCIFFGYTFLDEPVCILGKNIAQCPCKDYVPEEP